MSQISQSCLDQLFLKAHTQNGWLDQPVSDAELQELFKLMIMGPTSANCSPLRLVFVRTPEAKARLLPALSPGNVEKTRTAPVTAILGYDLEFYEKLPKLFPHTDARSWFAGKPTVIAETAFRNGTLQGGYFIMAARAVGLDCGPMSGFDAAPIEAAFFPEGKIKVNFICNLGHGDPAKVMPRSPRFKFDEVCKVI